MSVCGTGAPRASPPGLFSAAGSRGLGRTSRPHQGLGARLPAFSPRDRLPPCTGQARPGSPFASASPQRITSPKDGSGMLTGFPSPTPLGLGLGPDSPGADEPGPGTLRLSARGTPTHVLAYSFRHPHFPPLHQGSRPGFHADGNALLPRPLLQATTPGFGGRLQSRPFSAQAHSTGELLRTLSRMAASKPTSPLSGHAHLLCPTKPPLGDLSRGSGVFPSRRRTLSPADCLPGSTDRHSQFARSWYPSTGPAP